MKAKLVNVILTVLFFNTTVFANELTENANQANKNLWVATLKLKAEMQGDKYEDVLCETASRYHKYAMQNRNIETLVVAQLLLDQCVIERAKSVANN